MGIFGRGNRYSPSFDLACSVASETPSGSQDPCSLSSEVSLSREILSPVGKTAGGPSHFFSLPNWTRRILPSSSRKNLANLAVDEHGTIASNPPRAKLPLNKDKDLPPDPPRDSGPRAHSSDNGSRMALLPVRSGVEQGRKTARRPSTANGPNSPSKRRDIHPDVHNDSIVPIVVPPVRCLRPSKSSHCLRSAAPTNGFLKGHDTDSRSRVISLAVAPVRVKARGGVSLCSELVDFSPSHLTRKPSLWSRKITSMVHPTPSGSPALPVVTPTSPFQVNFDSESDASPRHRGESGCVQVKRRHSEKAFRRPSTNRDLPALPLPNLAHRPSTAGPLPSLPPVTRRPATADSSARLRAQSLFTFSSKAVNSSKGPVATIRVDKPIPHPVTNDSSNVRPRSATNPPLLHRLSVNLFSPSPTSGTKSGGFFVNGTSSPVTKSPRPSLSQIPVERLKPLAEEPPGAFVQRLTSLISKADIASVLASRYDYTCTCGAQNSCRCRFSGQGIYADSLKLYLSRFAFFGDPLDVALRRLLMDVGLPRETQQIDRVVEAFANRYMTCNPDLFSSSGMSYIYASIDASNSFSRPSIHPSF